MVFFVEYRKKGTGVKHQGTIQQSSVVVHKSTKEEDDRWERKEAGTVAKANFSLTGLLSS
jgi:hypothetical protein